VFAHRSQHRFAIPRRKRPQIENVGADAWPFRPPASQRSTIAPQVTTVMSVTFADALRDAERQREIIAG
jgi:hypothetical protein